jgi:hypothetical protein
MNTIFCTVVLLVIQGVALNIGVMPFSKGRTLHRSAIVLLQDRVHHVGESGDGCQKSLTTMYSIMLPRNPPPENFGQLLKVFRTSRRIHHLIELNLVASANFALGWVQKWHPRLN